MTTKLRSSLLPQAAVAVIALSAAAFGVQAQDKPAAGSTTAAAPAQPDAVFQRADANHDGKLTRDEAARIPAIAEKFDQLDKDKDGLLSLDEVKAAEMPK